MNEDRVTFRVLMEDESEHLERCARCGELIDDRDLQQILHHRGADHQPMTATL